MTIFSHLRKNLLSPSNAGLAVLSAILLILAFPDFDLWLLAWVGLVPLVLAVEREKDSIKNSFLVGWLFGAVFFFGTCWWLTFAPITYAGLPWLLTYFFMVCAASVVGIFPGIFGALLAIVLRRCGRIGLLTAPLVWTAVEFLRYWLTGNNWNAIAYSQAFVPLVVQPASVGGVYLLGCLIVLFNSLAAYAVAARSRVVAATLAGASVFFLLAYAQQTVLPESFEGSSVVVAVQPNVPMSGLTYEKYQYLLRRHAELAENALREQRRATSSPRPTIIVFPESPMIFQYGRDSQLRDFLKDFAIRNKASVLFNSAELAENGRDVLNSAVMINEQGEKIGQYDKIHLVPFGEYIPFPEPLASQMPAFVGTFAFGSEYDLFPLGEARAGVMICFESHFGVLSREYVRQGADVLIEMTNDGYLGETPVLRQHLANSIFRAVETNRPLLRVTNVGITAYITGRGEVIEPAGVYRETARVWNVARSDQGQTFYVKYGDWFAWLCSLLTLALLFLSFGKRKEIPK